MFLRMLLVWICLSAPVAAQAPPTLVIQNGHGRPVSQVRFSPGGEFLASAGGAVKVWNVETGQIALDVEGESFEFSSDGRQLAVGRGHRVDLLETSTGRTLHRLGQHPAPVRMLRFSPDGKRLLTAGRSWVEEERSAVLWDTDTGGVVARLEGHSEDLRGAAFHPAGKLLATAAGTSVKLWEVSSGRLFRELEPVSDELTELAFSPDGKLLAGAGWRRAWIWDSQGQRLRVLEGHREEITGLSFGAGFLATASRDGTARLWDPGSGTCRAVLRGHTDFVDCLDAGSDRLVTGSRDGTVRVWDASGKLLHVLERGQGGVLAVDLAGDTLAAGSDGGDVAWWTAGMLRHGSRGAAAEVRHALFDPRAEVLAVASRDGTLKLWNLIDGRLSQLETGEVCAMAIDPQGRRLAAALADRSLCTFDLRTGLVLESQPPDSELVRAAAFQPDGSLVLATGQGITRVRDGRRSTQGPAWGWVLALAMSSDGSLVATSHGDHSLSLWRTQDGRRLGQIPGLPSWAAAPTFSPDGALLAFGVSGSVVLCDLSKGEARSLAHESEVSALAFDPEGRRLASGTRDGQLALWDVPTGALITRVQGHRGDVWTLRFRPGGKVLASAGTDGLVAFRQLPGLELLATALAMKRGNDWLVTTPEGFFDGSPAGWRRIVWRLGDIRDVAEPEQFFQDFYHPGLLAEVLAGGRPLRELLRERQDPRAQLDLWKTDRRLPSVRFHPLPPESGQRLLDVTLEVREAPPDPAHPGGSGAKDVRLLRNGVLVRRWQGAQASGELSARGVLLESGPNRFTAYAFNADNVKSRDAEATVIGGESLRVAPTARILAIGIDDYADDAFGNRYDLAYARADAKAILDRLSQSLGPTHGRVIGRTLLDGEATRDGIVRALRELCAEAQPEDTVIVSYSGHGLIHRGHFYMVPHDLRRAERDTFHGVSDQDLEELLLDLQARKVCLVLDACRSGGALESGEWRQGPWNARGLAQLAYDKGLEILTASQSQEAAQEAWSVGGQPIGHGLLTFALVGEGLERAPRRGGVLLVSDWLDYAARRVPELIAGSSLEVQVPRVFHRRHGAPAWPVAGSPAP